MTSYNTFITLILLVWFVFIVNIIEGEDWFYDPKCSIGCSQSIHGDNNIEYLDQKEDLESCKAALNELSSTSIDSSSPITYLMIADYSTVFHDNTTNGIYGDYEGSWSAVNLTYRFNPNVADLVTGAVFTMEAVSPDDDSHENTKFSCRGYKFSRPLGLGEIQDSEGNQYTHFFNCLRGQRPGYEYEFTIRLLSNSSSAKQLHKFYYRIPACSYNADDMICKDDYGYSSVSSMELPSLWKPQYFIAESLAYGEISVMIELPPDQYNFTTLELSVTGSRNPVTVVHVNSFVIQETVEFERHIRYIQVNLTNEAAGEEISVKMIPTPDPNTCLNAAGGDLECSITESKYLAVYDNPCDSLLCGAHEICQPIAAGPNHKCVCKDGFVTIKEKCVANYCFPTNPCSSAGECSLTNNGYTCDCHKGYIYHGGTCHNNPCRPDPCEPHGTCQLNQRSRLLTYNCDCDDNYKYNLTTCTDNVCLTSNPCGTNFKSCNILSDPVCTCEHKYVYHEGRGCVVSPAIVASTIFVCAALVGVVILVFYYWRTQKLQRIGEMISKHSICGRSGRGNDINVEEDKTQSLSVSVTLDPDPPLIPSTSNRRNSVVTNHIANAADDDRCMEMNPTNCTPVEPVWIKSKPRLVSDISLVKKTKLLILSANDNPEHVNIVQALADFLQSEKNMFSVNLPCWCQQEITKRGWDEWFEEKLIWADKVILIASAETQVTNNGHYKSSDVTFVKAVNYVVDQCLYGASQKYQMAYFDHSDIDMNIPPLLKHLPKYQLMRHMEALFFKLHGIEKYDVGKERSASWTTVDMYYKDSHEGAMLRDAIQTMKKSITNHNNTSVKSHRYVHQQNIVVQENAIDSQIPFLSLTQVISQTGLYRLFQDSQSPSCRPSRIYPEHDYLSVSDSSRGFEEAFTEITGRSPHNVDVESINSTWRKSSI